MSALIDEIAAFIGSGDGDFGTLALRLFEEQRAANPGLAAIAGDAAPSRWQDIPAVPVSLFRELPLTCFPPEEATVVFRTSGTTGARGQKRLRDTVIYDLAARRHAEAVLGPLPSAGLGLVPLLPDSSLGHMCAGFCRGLQTFFSAERGVDGPGFRAALAAAQEPLFLPGTAFAWAELVGGAFAPVDVPPGSVLMVTGGFKGRHTVVDESALLGLLGARFPGARLVAEYGMTELSSQLWSEPAGTPYTPPPWLGVTTVDPWSGAAAAQGLLRFVDLANHQTVMAIETQDLGRVLPDGRVELLGRLPGARVRGCSLAVEEAGEDGV